MVVGSVHTRTNYFYYFRSGEQVQTGVCTCSTVSIELSRHCVLGGRLQRRFLPERDEPRTVALTLSRFCPCASPAETKFSAEAKYETLALVPHSGKTETF